MNQAKFPIFDKLQVDYLEKNLQFMDIKETRLFCEKLKIPSKGMKGEVINRLLTYIKTGNIITQKEIPEISRAQKGKSYILSASTYILHGSYKNDYNTRIFLQSLIGKHFHFTAFGQDYIKEKWLEGKPITYQEFALYWEKEYQLRKNKKGNPKKEWAYLTFLQEQREKNKDLSEKELKDLWNKVKEEKLQEIRNIFNLS